MACHTSPNSRREDQLDICEFGRLNARKTELREELADVEVRAAPAAALLSRNLLVFGLGGVILPFPCIKLIDLILTRSGLV